MSVSLNSTSITNISHSGSESAERKRKRELCEWDGVDLESFVVKPAIEDDVYSKPTLFTPICVLDRAQVPLSYIHNCATGPRVIKATISVIDEPEHRLLDHPVLIARDGANGVLHAIEKLQSRRYALCRLATWVDEVELRNKAAQLSQPYKRTVRRLLEHRNDEETLPWWKTASVEQVLQPAGFDSNTAKLMSSSMLQVNSRLASENDDAKLHNIIGLEGRIERANGNDTVAQGQTAPAEPLEELSKQYLEALYVSRMSLAYFTKGPLSRARAAFALSDDVAAKRQELLDFLGEAILSSNVIDKKYREGIMAVVKEMMPPAPGTLDQSKRPRKKRRWKASRGKTGLFVNEADYIARWWNSDIDLERCNTTHEHPDSTSKSRLSHLRSRETYLQVILVLEVLALEATPINSGTKFSGEPLLELKKQHLDVSNQQIEVATKRSKKPRDLTALLENLLDKLCIWHSVASDPVQDGETSLAGDGTGSNDEPGNFCIEVIIPFYSSRIPKEAAIVNKRLGGPNATSPDKRKGSGFKRSSELVSRRLPPKRKRDPLHRVSSNTLDTRISKMAPSLHRSATDSQLDTQPRIKRENSQTPSLHSVPAAPVQTQPRKRPSLLQTLAKREVDLNAASQATEARRRKKAEVDDKLREAISALKKPNRSLATREVADAADASFAKVTQKKRPGQPVRRDRSTFALSRGQHEDRSIDVSATPSISRTVDATLYKTVAREDESNAHFSATHYVPSSSIGLLAADNDARNMAVPATGHRLRHLDAGEPSSHSANRQQMPALESPVLNRRTAAFVGSTPSKPSRTFPLETPAKTSVDHVGVPSSTLRPPTMTVPDLSAVITRKRDEGGYTASIQPASGLHEGSIYNEMGWNDDYDDLA